MQRADLTTLGAWGVTRLVAHKLVHRGRRLDDTYGGARRMGGAEARWAARWLESWGDTGVASWLRRSGAGRLWLDPSDAAQWCRETTTRDDLELASRTAEGTFDLIGSGPIDLGKEPRWLTDLYTGREWRIEPCWTLPLVASDGSDVRTVWELSRCYHFVALARAYWSTEDPRFARAFAVHVESWIDQNPPGLGPHWASPMDVAIRSANWALAAVLFADAPEVRPDTWARLLSALRTAAGHVQRHLEWHPVYRGNHFVSNAVGLLYVGALFLDDRSGRRWYDRGANILVSEMDFQVHPSGVSFEASLAYHRLVTEFFSRGSDVIRENSPEVWPGWAETRLLGMYRFIDAYLPESGLSPMIGDADDGRLHALSARGMREPRRHRLGLDPTRFPDDPPPQSFAGGGFYVLRHGADHCVIRCGPVGLNGAGSHDHNDQLSFELVINGRRLIRDSGTYCYTRDLDARAAFRATAAHNVVQVGCDEQNPIRADCPWRILEDRTRSQCDEWDPEELVFEGSHRGFSNNTVVSRRVSRDSADDSWCVTDRVRTRTDDPVLMRFHLDLAVGDRAPQQFHDDRLALSEVILSWGVAVKGVVKTAPVSDQYGTRRDALVVEVELPDSGEITTRIHAGPDRGNQEASAAT